MKLQLPHSFPLSSGALSVVLACLGSHVALAQNSGLAGLYAAQPPAGSSYVRLVNATGAPLKVTVGAAAVPVPQVGVNSLASNYRVMDPLKPPAITVNGQPVVEAVKLVPNGFSTLVISMKGSDPVVQSQVDNPEGQNALKAVLRAYNLVPQCALTVAVVGGPAVFERIGLGENRARAINPSKATLVARCDQSESPPLALPSLSAGDKYSLFVTGDATKPQLVGQMDLTEPYGDKR